MVGGQTVGNIQYIKNKILEKQVQISSGIKSRTYFTRKFCRMKKGREKGVRYGMKY